MAINTTPPHPAKEIAARSLHPPSASTPCFRQTWSAIHPLLSCGSARTCPFGFIRSKPLQIPCTLETNTHRIFMKLSSDLDYSISHRLFINETHALDAMPLSGNVRYDMVEKTEPRTSSCPTSTPSCPTRWQLKFPASATIPALPAHVASGNLAADNASWMHAVLKQS